jgi:hypothetical protein
MLNKCAKTKESVFAKSRNQMMELYEEIFSAESFRVKAVIKVLVSSSIINKSMYDGNSNVQLELTTAMDKNDIESDMGKFKKELVCNYLFNSI